MDFARTVALGDGWTRPPDILITQDPNGLALTLGLIVKEVPFLLLMVLAALGQIPQEQSLKTSLSLGHSRVSGWLVSVFPSVYAQIRLPVYVVLAYSMSVVDVALILGPTTPSTLSVQIVKWMGDPDLNMRLTGAAAALLQLALVIFALLVWRLAEWGVKRIGILWIERGVKGLFDGPGRAAGFALGSLTAIFVLFGVGRAHRLVICRVLGISRRAERIYPSKLGASRGECDANTWANLSHRNGRNARFACFCGWLS